jgi:hypothetical protein
LYLMLDFSALMIKGSSFTDFETEKLALDFR